MNPSIEHILIKAFISDRGLWERYHSEISLEYIKDVYPEVYKVFLCIDDVYKDPNKRQISVEELRQFYIFNFPREGEYCDGLFDYIARATVEESTGEILRRVGSRAVAKKIADHAMQVVTGHSQFDSLVELGTKAFGRAELPGGESQFVDTRLSAILDSVRSTTGLRWRLNTLNRMAGSIRKGDLVIVFARPETGKTTFLADQVSYALTQTDKPVLWFNNEEQGAKVALRVIQSYFSVKIKDLEEHRDEFERRFQEEVGNRFKLVDNAILTKREVEAVCRDVEPGLIVVDQLDKLRGFADDRNDLVLKAIYGWARELAKQFAPLIGVCQAGATAENKKWLDMSDMDNSKTGKAGEADLILGIGKVDEPGYENVRYLKLCKNKLPGDPDTEPVLRHGKEQVLIRGDIARYEDV